MDILRNSSHDEGTDGGCSRRSLIFACQRAIEIQVGGAPDTAALASTVPGIDANTMSYLEKRS